jgi:hypothetical protein
MKKLEQNIFEMLFGCLLGDAHIGIHGDKVYVTFEQTLKRKDYVMYIYDLLSGVDGIELSEIKYYKRTDSRYNSINESIYFKIHGSELLSPLADIFLLDNKKVAPIDIEKYLSPIAFAHWICDDGQLVKNGGITLCTDNYTLDEVNLMIKALTNKYDLKCTIHLKKGKLNKIYPRIYIGKKSLDKIKPLIIPYVHASFLYKLHL